MRYSSIRNEVATLRKNAGADEFAFETLTKTVEKPVTRFPVLISDLIDVENTVRHHILNHTPRDAISITKQSNIVTVGSCFASDIARSLTGQGFKARNLSIGEVINSTYANLELVLWALGLAPTISSEMRYSREQLRDMLTTADVVIYTLGVAPCFFEKAELL